jgi:hypothetical protein
VNPLRTLARWTAAAPERERREWELQSQPDGTLTLALTHYSGWTPIHASATCAPDLLPATIDRLVGIVQQRCLQNSLDRANVVDAPLPANQRSQCSQLEIARLNLLKQSLWPKPKHPPVHAGSHLGAADRAGHLDTNGGLPSEKINESLTDHLANREAVSLPVLDSRVENLNGDRQTGAPVSTYRDRRRPQPVICHDDLPPCSYVEVQPENVTLMGLKRARDLHWDLCALDPDRPESTEICNIFRRTRNAVVVAVEEIRDASGDVSGRRWWFGVPPVHLAHTTDLRIIATDAGMIPDDDGVVETFRWFGPRHLQTAV